MSDQIQIKVKLKNLRVSPRKTRLVADLIRGMDVSLAQKQLAFLNKKVASSMLKLLNSGLANAKNNFDLNPENLFVKSIFVNEGPTMKRWRPRAMGRATQIRKRTSHIEMLLEPKGEKIIGKVKRQAGKPEITQGKVKAKEVLTKKTDIKEKDNKQKHPTSPAGRPTSPAGKEKRPYGASGSAKEKSFSRQTGGGNVGKKVFRRKSI